MQQESQFFETGGERNPESAELICVLVELETCQEKERPNLANLCVDTAENELSEVDMWNFEGEVAEPVLPSQENREGQEPDRDRRRGHAKKDG